MTLQKPAVIAIVSLAMLGLLAYLLPLLAALALHDSFTSIANDAANYLVMARHYSPWQPESAAVAAVWPLQDFPPAFPMLLAITRGAESFYQAHLLVLVMGFAGLLVLYYLAIEILQDRALALATTVLFALTPGFVLGLQGILSESMFLWLSASFLLLFQQRQRQGGPKVMLGLALLLALVILTRSQGYVLLIAVACQAVVAIRTRGLRPSLDRLSLCLGAGVLVALAMWLIGPERESHYVGVLLQFLQGDDPTQLGDGWSLVSTQLLSLVDGWRSFFLLYWVGDAGAPSLITLFILLSACTGTALRLKQNQLDGWYVLGGVGLLLLWPHPGQMVRLLFPLVPLMLIHSLYAVSTLLRQRVRGPVARSVGLVVCLVTAAPVLTAHAFIHGRLAIAQEHQLVPVYEMLRRLDVDRGLWEARIQNRMLADFANLRETANPQAPLFYVRPEYPALLSDRVSREMSFPADTALEHIQSQGGGEVLLTRLHPRMNRVGLSGFRKSARLQASARRQGCTAAANQQEKVSCLYTLEGSAPDEALRE